MAKSSRFDALARRLLHREQFELAPAKIPAECRVNQPSDMAIQVKPPPPHIIIAGGGLAGLAVASCLINRGVRLTLLESRPRLGGRASSFHDPETGELVDNCQHVSMACCTNLAHFCRKVGIYKLLRRERELVVLDREGLVSRFRAGPLPAPLHLIGSFVRARFLNVREKLQLAYGIAQLSSFRKERPGESFENWLVRHGQTRRVISMFWEPLLVSALNQRTDRMDVNYARKVLLDGFLRNREGFNIEIPLVPLGELYGRHLEDWLRKNGVTVHLNRAIRRIVCDEEGSVCGVELRNGDSIVGDLIVLAVPFDKVSRLVPEQLRKTFHALEGLDLMRASPIVGVHLWFDRPVCPYEFVVTPGRLIQWVFDHTAIQGRGVPASMISDVDSLVDRVTRPTAIGQYLQLVISASHELSSLNKGVIRDRVLAELTEIWPVVNSARLLRSWVIVEHAATFSARPGVDALRPSQITGVDGLILAGDYTRTSWPATMEGAVRSGYLAAQEILRILDRPIRLIQPALRTRFVRALLVRCLGVSLANFQLSIEGLVKASSM